MKCSPGISNFLEEISIFFSFYYFPLFLCTDHLEDFLISPFVLWNSAFKWVYLSFSLCLSLLFLAIFIRGNNEYNMWIYMGGLSESRSLMTMWITYMRHYFLGFLWPIPFDLPGSQLVFDISQDPPICGHASHPRWILQKKHVDRAFLDLHGAFLEYVWLRRSPDFKNEKYVLSYLLPGHSPASSLIILLLLVLEFQTPRKWISNWFTLWEGTHLPPAVFVHSLKPFTTDWDLNPCAGTWTQAKPSLGLEPIWLRLKPSQNPWHLVSGSNKAQVLDVSLQKEFSERQSEI